LEDGEDKVGAKLSKELQELKEVIGKQNEKIRNLDDGIRELHNEFRALKDQTCDPCRW